MKKSSSLLKYYYKLSKKRGISVSVFRNLERQGFKLMKLKLDLKYFDSCLDLKICPNYLKFKPPNLRVYKNCDEFCQVAVYKKRKEILKDKNNAEKAFQRLKLSLMPQLSFFEKNCLKGLLNDVFEKKAKPIIYTHQKKLFNLWKSQSDKCPDCIMNLSSKNLTLQEKTS